MAFCAPMISSCYTTYLLYHLLNKEKKNIYVKNVFTTLELC